MEDNQPQPTDDEFLAMAAQQGWSQEETLRRRWGKVAKHKVLRRIFELLKQQPDRQMYIAEIARALEVQQEWVRREIVHNFKWTKVVEEEHRGQRTYYKLRPGMVEEYQRWLDTQKPDEPKP